jgi:hypothetical protein
MISFSNERIKRVQIVFVRKAISKPPTLRSKISRQDAELECNNEQGKAEMPNECNSEQGKTQRHKL